MWILSQFRFAQHDFIPVGYFSVSLMLSAAGVFFGAGEVRVSNVSTESGFRLLFCISQFWLVPDVAAEQFLWLEFWLVRAWYLK